MTDESDTPEPHKLKVEFPQPLNPPPKIFYDKGVVDEHGRPYGLNLTGEKMGFNVLKAAIPNHDDILEYLSEYVMPYVRQLDKIRAECQEKVREGKNYHAEQIAAEKIAEPVDHLLRDYEKILKGLTEDQQIPGYVPVRHSYN